MTIKIKTITGLKLYFYDVQKIIEKENSIFLQNTTYPFIIGINDAPGAPMSTYGMDIYKCHIKEIIVKQD